MKRTAHNTNVAGAVTADATRPRRLLLYELLFGCDAAPADNMFKLRVRRCTTLGTGTSVTPKPLNPADAATEADAAENHTANGTITANSEMIEEASHQRNSFRWNARPGYEIVGPATASNGFVFETPVGPASSIMFNAYFREE